MARYLVELVEGERSEWSHDSGQVWYDLGRCFHLDDGRLVKVVGVAEAPQPFDQKLIVTPE